MLRWGLWLLLLWALVTVGWGLYRVGFLVGRGKLFPDQIVSRIASRLDGEQLALHEIYNSIFLRLEARGVEVPRGRAGRGGGLTSVGGEVVLLTHDGRFFAATGPGDLAPLAIAAPENGFEAYRAAAARPEFRDMNHRFEWFRYNDVAYREAGGQGWLVASYTEWHDARACYTNTVATLALEPGVPLREAAAAAGDWQVLFRTEPCLPLKREWRAIEGLMAGGRMAFGPDGMLYLASGDYHWDGVYGPEVLAQGENDYGRVIAIDPDTGASRRLGKGNRNMQGIAFDRAGDLYVAEHGPRGGDELNRVRKGANFGWPLVTYGTAYNEMPWPKSTRYGRHDGFDLPVFAWLPSVAISAMTRAEGFHPAWDGDLVMGTLKGRMLVRIRIRDRRVVFAERIPVDARVRHVHQHTDGRLVMWTDEGLLVFLSPAPQDAVEEFVAGWIADNAGGIGAARLTEAITACRECHSLWPDGDASAPGLGGIWGAPVGAGGYAGTSEALAAAGGRWTAERLDAFLADPDAFAPGTAMPDPGLDDPELRAAVVRFLADLTRDVER